MIQTRTNRALRALFAFIAAGSLTAGGWAAEGNRSPVAVAVTEADVEAIVAAVGGNQIETFHLFKGCILRKDLAVEPAAKARLSRARVLVWTGFLREAEAINQVLQPSSGAPAVAIPWLDVSLGAFRTNVPFTTCEGYADPMYATGDPFFWLNPENGVVIARNIAEGLSKAVPEAEGTFHANAEAFIKGLRADITRWKAELRPLHEVRVFSSQCGWQNFSNMGGPKFIVCKATPGQLPSPAELLAYLVRMKVQVVLVDPNTPPEYAQACREQPGLRVLRVPSSIEALPGGKAYGDIFENLIKLLLAGAA